MDSVTELSDYSDSETTADGVYGDWVDDGHMLYVRGPGQAVFTDAQGNTYNDYVYVVNNNSSPRVTMTYTSYEDMNPSAYPEKHQILAWRFDADLPDPYNTHMRGYSDYPSVQGFLKLFNYEVSDDQRTHSFDCVKEVEVDGKTQPALASTVELSPVMDLIASDFNFHTPELDEGWDSDSTEEHPDYYVTAPDSVLLETTYYKVVNGEIDASTATSECPTEPGCYQLAVKATVNTKFQSDSYSRDYDYIDYDQNRVFWQYSGYRQVNEDITKMTSDKITTDEWRFAIAGDEVTLTVDENGKPVLPEDAAGVHYSSGVLTIDKGFTVGFDPSDIVTCDIVNNGLLNGGNFTGKVTGSGSILSGLFTHKPANTTSMWVKATCGASINGITDPSGETTMYPVLLTGGKAFDISILYTDHDADHPVWGWFINNVTPNESEYAAQPVEEDTPDALVAPFDAGMPSSYDEHGTIISPVLPLNESDLKVSKNGEVTTDIPNVAVTVDEYSRRPDGTYDVTVSLKSTKDWSFLPDELQKNEDAMAFFSHLTQNGDLYYYMPDTLTVNAAISFDAPPVDEEGKVTVPEGGKVEGDGWTAENDSETGETTVTITDAKNLEDTTLDCDKITIGSTDAKTDVSNITTNADVTVTEGSNISGGTYSGNITGEGSISGGVFTGKIDDTVDVTGGIFAEESLPEAVNAVEVKVTGGASIQELSSVTAKVVNSNGSSQELTLTYPSKDDREFYGWQTTAGDNKELTDDNTVSISATAGSVSITPVLNMVQSDLNVPEWNEDSIPDAKDVSVSLPNVPEDQVVVTGIQYRDQATSDVSSEYPTQAGTYDVLVALGINSAAENSIALFADPAADRVVEGSGVGYFVPTTMDTGKDVTIKASETPDPGPDVPDVPGGDDTPDTPADGSGAGAGAAIAVGAVAAGSAAYIIGTQVYLTSVLPEGTAIPTNKAALAAVLWNAAGKPEPQSTALFADIVADASETQKAARWCVEQGLISANGDKFSPKGYTFRAQVIKAWNQLQKTLNAEQ